MAKKSEGRLLSPSTAYQSGIDLGRTEQRGPLLERLDSTSPYRTELEKLATAAQRQGRHYPGRTVLGAMAAQSQDNTSPGGYHQLLNRERT